MDVEGKLELPHLVRTDAHAVLYGAVVFQCCMKKGEGRGQEGRGGGEKGTGGERRGREGDRRGEEGEGRGQEGRGGGGRNIRNKERRVKWSRNTVTNQFIY